MKYSEYFKTQPDFKLARHLYEKARQLNEQANSNFQLAISQPLGITSDQIAFASSAGYRLKTEMANTQKEAITEEISVIEKLLPSIADSELKSSMESALQALKRK